MITYYQSYRTVDLDGNETIYKNFPLHNQFYSYMEHVLFNGKPQALLLMSKQLKVKSPRYYQQTVDKLFHLYFTTIYPKKNEFISTLIQMGANVSLAGEFALRKVLNMDRFEDAQQLMNAGAQLRPFIRHFIERAGTQHCRQSIDFIIHNHINTQLYLNSLLSSYPNQDMTEEAVLFLTYLEKQGLCLQEVMPSLFEQGIKKLNVDLVTYIIKHYSISLELIQSSLEEIAFSTQRSSSSIENCSKIISLLVSQGGNPNTTNSDTKIPLYMFAVTHKQNNLFDILVNYGLELNNSALIIDALFKNNQYVIHSVLSQQFFNEKDWQKFLLLSIRNGDSFFIDLFVEQGFELNFNQSEALTEALNYYEPSIAFHLIEKGIDINVNDSQFLMHAIEKEHIHDIEKIYSLGGHLPTFNPFDLSNISENVLSHVNLLEGKYQLQQQLNNELSSQQIKNQPKI